MKKIKAIRLALIILGFIFQYIIPLVMFGRVIPFTHGEIAAGLTKGGIFVLCVFALIMIGKLKERVEHIKDEALREIIKSAIYAVPIVIVAVFLNWLAPAIETMRDYWFDIIPMFCTGRVLIVISKFVRTDAEEVDK